MRPVLIRNKRSKLDGVRREFERWRESRKPGARIPDALWQAAAEVAREHGMSRTSLDLRLDYNSLKKRMEPAPESRDSGFVEIPLVPVAVPGTCESMIEIEDEHGTRMRVELKGASSEYFEVVVRSLWGMTR
jgi:hypothetical protein